MVNCVINGVNVRVEEGTTILEAAKSVGINIPTLCFLKEINEIGACRVCVVEVEGEDRCVTACNNTVKEGMVIKTNSRKVRTTRKTNVKLILSQHDYRCASCVRSGNCKLQEIANDLNISDMPYEIKPEKYNFDDTFPLVRDSAKCIKCMRCVQICDKVQQLHVWDVVNTGARTTINVSKGRKIADADCAICGQCASNCPVGALRERDDVGIALDAAENPDVITVVQIAPAVRTAWGESMGLSKDEATVNKIADGLKKIGFDYVFDTTFSADLTIMEEGSELLENLPRIRRTGIPMFTSCCPGWVRFVNSQYPKIAGHISTAKSPQQMFGAITKSYFAKKLGVSPDKIFCVSIMPCISKKDESTWEGMERDVDVVLTTRELQRLFHSYYLNPKNLKDIPLDSPLGTGTGAGVIFGATGGVMEAALRSAYYLVTKENPNADAFKSVRGFEGWKEAEFDLAGNLVKIAVASGLGNARKIIESILAGKSQYDFVEIMACPGGCINGGGQPIHDGESFVDKRAGVLYTLDATSELRYSHENPEVIKCYEEYLGAPLSEKAHHLLHTKED